MINSNKHLTNTRIKNNTPAKNEQKGIPIGDNNANATTASSNSLYKIFSHLSFQ